MQSTESEIQRNKMVHNSDVFISKYQINLANETSFSDCCPPHPTKKIEGISWKCYFDGYLIQKLAINSENLVQTIR